MEELEEKQLQLQNQNMLSNEKKPVTAFKNFLTEIGVDDTDFFTYTLWRIQDFPLGGGGAPTSDTYTFQQKHMQK